MFYLYGHAFCNMFTFCEPIIQRNLLSLYKARMRGYGGDWIVLKLLIIEIYLIFESKQYISQFLKGN